jgi:hypothetical protein
MSSSFLIGFCDPVPYRFPLCAMIGWLEQLSSCSERRPVTGWQVRHEEILAAAVHEFYEVVDVADGVPAAVDEQHWLAKLAAVGRSVRVGNVALRRNWLLVASSSSELLGNILGGDPHPSVLECHKNTIACAASIFD